MMLTAVGASVWASGSQLWNGHSGILTANAANRRNQITPAGIKRSEPATFSGIPMMPSAGIDTMANVSTPLERNNASIPTSMKALPARVKITNFIAEYWLRPLPQIEMSMNIGISSISQKMKNSRKSSAVKTPSTAV